LGPRERRAHAVRGAVRGTDRGTDRFGGTGGTGRGVPADCRRPRFRLAVDRVRVRPRAGLRSLDVVPGRGEPAGQDIAGRGGKGLMVGPCWRAEATATRAGATG